MTIDATIDLNADVGEGCDDEPLFRLVTSVNVACGGHAGDEESMRRAIRAAVRLRLALGAHPSYPDRAGFGRRAVDVEPGLLEESLVAQIASLERVARAEGGRIEHVKPHGALYNLAARDDALARLVVRAVARSSRRLLVVGLAGGRLLEAAREAGLETLAEAFADRGYAPDGSLVCRDQAGSVITAAGRAAAQAISIARHGRVTAIGGESVALRAGTLCVHGDTPGAAAIAAAVRHALEAAGVAIRRYRGAA